MRTTVTKTVTEEQIICDHCGKPVIYSEQSCVVCGKAACHECVHQHLVELSFQGFPKFWPVLASVPTFHAYACVTCRNKLTRRFAAVKAKTDRANAQCAKWHLWYLKQIEILNKWKPKQPRGFTLIELLTVIAIIAILAAMLVPTLTIVRNRAKRFQAQAELGALVTAVRSYEAHYGRLPIRNATLAGAAAEGHGGDVTFGPGLSNTNSNCDVCIILADLDRAPNQGHRMNPQRIVYLNARLDTNGVWLDPWGSPYVVTLDANADDKAADALYALQPVASNGPAIAGLKGLRREQVDGQPLYVLHSSVMAWSMGPDKKASQFDRADRGANKDNVTSW